MQVAAVLAARLQAAGRKSAGCRLQVAELQAAGDTARGQGCVCAAHRFKLTMVGTRVRRLAFAGIHFYPTSCLQNSCEY